MQGHHGFTEVSSGPKDFRRSVARMMAVLWRPEMRRWRPRFVAALLLTVLAKGLSVLGPVLLGLGINAAISDEASARTAAGLGFTGFILMFGGARFLSNALPQVRDAFFTRVTRDANRIIAVDAYAHAQSQSLQFHVTRRAGALARIIDRGSAAVEFMLRFLAFNIGPTIVELVFAAVVMAALYSWTLAVAAIVTVILYTIFTVKMTEWRNKLRRTMNDADTKVRAMSMDTLANFETVKAFAAEDREADRYDSGLQNYNRHYVRSMQSMHALNAGQELIMTGGLVAVALIAGYSTSMKVGDITAVILMMTNIYRPLNILGFAWREIKQGAVDIEKLFDLLDLKPEISDDVDAGEISPTNGTLKFDNVSFEYAGREAGLEDISLSIAGGSFVGIVGPSGAGKSTILKLLLRFYDPSQGRISFDGTDISTVTQHSLRAAMAIVPQEVVLFNDTLRFNIAYGHPNATDAEIIAAAEKAQLGKFLHELPEGLETRVGERGLKLSGGEKQRVGVARAILTDPKILILDEATSSLDSTTEKEVQAALNAAASGRTTIAVAHRLSTIAQADEIFVLDRGQIVERGKHQNLLESNGIYAALWARQTKGEKEALSNVIS